MALLTKKEFAEKCGMTTGNLSNMVARKKVYYSGDYIDDSFEINKAFLQKMIEKRGGQPHVIKHKPKNLPKEVVHETTNVEQVVEQVFEPKIKNVAKPNLQPININVGNQMPTDASFLALEREKLTLQNEKLKEDIKLANRKNEKIAEESILVEHVKGLIVVQSESAKVAWENATEDLLVRITGEFKIPRDKIAKIKGMQNEIINKAIDRAMEESLKGLKRMQTEHANKKGRGEK